MRGIPIRYQADYRALVFVTFLFATYVTQYTGVFRHYLLLIVSCIFSFIVLVIRHNHIHCPIFIDRRWNTSFDFLLTLLTAQATDGVIAIHNERHHDHNHSEEDCVRSNLVRNKRNWLNLLGFFFVAAATARRKKAEDVRNWKKRNPSRYRKYWFEQSAVMCLVLALLIADWKTALTYFGIPLITGHWCIVTINLLQHQGCDHSSKYNHSRNITGRFINWLFLNNGFHTAHHLQPRLHWSLLPALHRKIVEPNARPSLSSNSLAVAIWKQFFASRL